MKTVWELKHSQFKTKREAKAALLEAGFVAADFPNGWTRYGCDEMLFPTSLTIYHGWGIRGRGLKEVEIQKNGVPMP